MKPFDQHIATALILFGNIAHALLIALQRSYRRHLQWSKSPVVMIAFDTSEGIHQSLITHHKANAPAGHVIAFRQGKELDGDISRAGHLHDGGRFPAVIHDIGIGQIVDDQNVILLRQSDNLFKEIQFDALRGRI